MGRTAIRQELSTTTTAGPSTSKDGAVTAYTYTYVDPYADPNYPAAVGNTQTATLNGRWKRTSFDGFGRVIKVETGYGSTVVSQVDTEYDDCACSPLGKMKRVSLPYLNVTDRKWTTYTYDGRGRTLNVVGPDGSSTTTYRYYGNRAELTDPKGKVKHFYSDPFGNLIKVDEPVTGGGVIDFTYDGQNRLRSVTMTRNGTTQTRTFTYTGAVLTSATNPENGTVQYEYNSEAKSVQCRPW